MTGKQKLRPMAEAPKTPVDQNGRGPVFLAWYRHHKDPYLVRWDEPGKHWSVPPFRVVHPQADFRGWIPVPEVEP